MNGDPPNIFLYETKKYLRRATPLDNNTYTKVKKLTSYLWNYVNNKYVFTV